MDIIIDQQVALDEALVPHATRLKSGKSNFRLRSDLKSKESTLQVVYDVLKLTHFYKAFLVTADVPKIYMQKFWATTTVHHQSIRFKMNNKKHIVNLEYFREMLQIRPRIPNQYLRLSQAQILWGMYHKKNVDFSYLLWEDFVYQDQSIPRRNKVNWHFARDDHMFTTIKLVSRHKNTQQYGFILPIELTNEAIKNSESYKDYYVIALGDEPPKTKASVRKKQSSSDTTMPPPTAKGKRLKTLAKVDKPAKEKQPAKMSKSKGADEGTGIIPRVPDVLTYESDEEEISWKSSEEDDDDEVNMSEHDEDVNDQSDDDDQNDDDDDDQDDDDDDQNDDDNEQTDSDNDSDDFIHIMFSTHDDEDKEEKSFDPIVQTPSHDEKTDDEDNDKDSDGMNVEGDEMDDE
uniref:Retrovirus-related Pol polyprotein from transposon TNT 1-94 n=1 Tax=Tanacetum cinerariifolium TaxID=118510 RepID=A0A6L2L864_TANCI|nr:hypothetical protein [Tanacetum cinerariifolium]